ERAPYATPDHPYVAVRRDRHAGDRRVEVGDRRQRDTGPGDAVEVVHEVAHRSAHRGARGPHVAAARRHEGGEPGQLPGGRGKAHPHPPGTVPVHDHRVTVGGRLTGAFRASGPRVGGAGRGDRVITPGRAQRRAGDVPPAWRRGDGRERNDARRLRGPG